MWHTAVGVNYADTHHRNGISHPRPVPPDPVDISQDLERRRSPFITRPAIMH